MSRQEPKINKSKQESSAAYQSRNAGTIKGKGKRIQINTPNFQKLTERPENGLEIHSINHCVFLCNFDGDKKFANFSHLKFTCQRTPLSVTSFLNRRLESFFVDYFTSNYHLTFYSLIDSQLLEIMMQLGAKLFLTFITENAKNQSFVNSTTDQLSD
jgi:hypothetical protein